MAPEAGIWFVPAGSEAGKILGERAVVTQLFQQSVVVIAGESVMTEEEAVCFLLKRLTGLWFLARPVCWLPSWFLRSGYRLIARNRLRFPKGRSCPVTDGSIQQRLVISQADLVRLES